MNDMNEWITEWPPKNEQATIRCTRRDDGGFDSEWRGPENGIVPVTDEAAELMPLNLLPWPLKKVGSLLPAETRIGFYRRDN